MLTVAQTAAKLGTNPETVRRWIRKGRLASERQGQEHFITEDALADFLKDNPKYARFSLATADREDVYEALKQRLAALEVIARGLKSQQDYVQAEIEALKVSFAQFNEKK